MLSPQVKAYVCREAVDMRLGIDGLSQLVGPLFTADALSGQVFVFLGKRRNRVKLLYWDRNGFWLAYKRLERGRFPKAEMLAQRGLTLLELRAYLEGVDLTGATWLPVVKATRIA